MSDEKLNEWLKKNIPGIVPKEKLPPEATAQIPKKPQPAQIGSSLKNSAKRARHGGAKHIYSRRKSYRNRDMTYKQTSRKPAGYPPHGVLRAIPLGGLDEVGKNMMVFEYEQDVVIVDAGFQFPEEDMLGIDYVIPDISYLENRTERIRGLIITHGHLDHIGAIPYILPKLNFPPVYATRLTLGLIRKRLEEFGIKEKARLHEIDPAKQNILGRFKADWFRVNHSIPDGVGVILHTPAGIVVHTGDFKFDYTPAFQRPADYTKIAALGSQNVVALFSDSTNALKPGHTMSEKRIGETLDKIIRNAKGRIIIASFSSLIGRIQQIINSAAIHGRKVFISGRSMQDNVAIARQLQFIKSPPGLVQPIKKIGNTKDEHVLILTTGAQGEALSALTRMALGDHSQIDIKHGDTVVLSSTPIPGNERSIYTVINNLVRLGARVIFNQVMDVHTSGHAHQEDLKLMINLVKPKYLVPIHGELFMRQAHSDIGRSIGVAERNTIILENGDVMTVAHGEAHKTKEKVSANYIMIDGKGIGDVGAQIIMDRQIMAENGALIVLFTARAKDRKLIRDPEVISRGFIYMKESREIMKETIAVSKKAYEEAISRMPHGRRGEIKAHIRGCLDRFSHRKIERHPLVLPIIVEV